jgi:hypothetical protein
LGQKEPSRLARNQLLFCYQARQLRDLHIEVKAAKKEA